MKYLKYAGSKARILEPITDLIMDGGSDFVTDGMINKFIEPFFGTGVVGMNVLAHSSHYNDANPDVIDCHRAVIKNPERVIELCEELWAGGYDAYYDVRNQFRKNKRTDSMFYRAAMFIYMNRFGFNGMVRYNLNGQFNVPVGKQSGKNPPMIPKEELLSFSRSVKLSQLSYPKDFEDVMEQYCGTGVTIYCDSPYVNLDSKGEIKYIKGGFNMDDQHRLAKAAERCRQSGSRVLVSNHDLPVTRELYKNATRIVEIDAFRSISSKGKTRGTAKELVAIYE